MFCPLNGIEVIERSPDADICSQRQKGFHEINLSSTNSDMKSSHSSLGMSIIYRDIFIDVQTEQILKGLLAGFNPSHLQ